jgi:hypothetical protein
MQNYTIDEQRLDDMLIECHNLFAEWDSRHCVRYFEQYMDLICSSCRVYGRDNPILQEHFRTVREYAPLYMDAKCRPICQL